MSHTVLENVFIFRIASNVGRAFGVALGCIIGMFPLLFYREDEEKESNEEQVPKN